MRSYRVIAGIVFGLTLGTIGQLLVTGVHAHPIDGRTGSAPLIAIDASQPLDERKPRRTVAEAAPPRRAFGAATGDQTGRNQAPAATEKADAPARPSNESETVYATRTGQKYHRAGCRYLARSQIPLTLKDASARYGPCSVCGPPLLRPSQAPATASQPSPTGPTRPQPSTSGRCQATTKKGTQCSRTAQAGRRYCWQH